MSPLLIRIIPVITTLVLIVGCSPEVSIKDAAHIKFLIDNKRLAQEEACSRFNTTPRIYQKIIAGLSKKEKKTFEAHYSRFITEMNREQATEQKRQAQIALLNANKNPETKLPINSGEKEMWIQKFYADTPRLMKKKLDQLRNKQKNMFVAGYNPFYIAEERPITSKEVRLYWKQKLFEGHVIKIDDPGRTLNRWFEQERKKTVYHDWDRRNPGDLRHWAAKSVKEVRDDSQSVKKEIKRRQEIYERGHPTRKAYAYTSNTKPLDEQKYQDLLGIIDKLDPDEKTLALARIREYQSRRREKAAARHGTKR